MTLAFRTSSRHPLRLVAATLVLALAAGVALTVKAQPAHGAAGPMAMMSSPRHVDHMLDMVNATADQRTQVHSIIDAAHADLKAQHQASGGLHEQAMQLFMQPTVDARAAEALRQQMLAQHDQASKRMMQAMLDISRVLTPEQRQLLGQKAAQHRAMMESRRAAQPAASQATN